MKVLQIAGSFFPAKSYGGSVATTRSLCAALQRSGCTVLVLTTNIDGRNTHASLGHQTLDGFEICYGRAWAPPDLSPSLAKAIGREVPRCDVVHVTGTYNWFLPLVIRAAGKSRKQVVVSPRGSLLPEARRRRPLKKAVFEHLGLRTCWRRVNAFHATSQAEADGIRGMVPTARTEIVPNGVDLPEQATWPWPTVAGQPGRLYVLYLGRLHPYKQPDLIVRAFAQASEGSSHVLVLAGGGEPAYLNELKRVIDECGVTARVVLAGQVTGEVKSSLLANAACVVLASRSENFGMSVAESFAHGTPCVVTRAAPWSGMEHEGCGYWVEDGLAGVRDGLGRILALSAADRAVMGANGRAWMARDFSWDTVARQMLALYESLTPGAAVAS